MRILLVASDKTELKLFSEDFGKAVSGVGPILAAASAMAAAKDYGAEALVSVGTAGSLGTLKKGEVISFSQVVCPDQNLTAMHLALGTTIDSKRVTVGSLPTADRTSPYVLASSGTFASSVTDALRLMKADASDMEAYGVGIAARILGIPFYAVKLISDVVGDDSSVGDISFSLREGRARLVEKVTSLLAL